MERNSFKRLVDDDEITMNQRLSSIESNLEGQISLFQYIGNIIDLYLPKVVDTFISASKTDTQSNTDSTKSAPHWRNRPSSGPRNGPGSGSGPVRGA